MDRATSSRTTPSRTTQGPNEEKGPVLASGPLISHEPCAFYCFVFRSCLLDDGGDRFGHDLDVVAVEGRHADTAVGYGVDAVFFAEHIDLG